jgi:hypothetical protein
MAEDVGGWRCVHLAVCACAGRSPAEGAYSEGFIKAKFTQDFCIGEARDGCMATSGTLLTREVCEGSNADATLLQSVPAPAACSALRMAAS